MLPEEAMHLIWISQFTSLRYSPQVDMAVERLSAHYGCEVILADLYQFKAPQTLTGEAWIAAMDQQTEQALEAIYQ